MISTTALVVTIIFILVSGVIFAAATKLLPAGGGNMTATAIAGVLVVFLLAFAFQWILPGNLIFIITTIAFAGMGASGVLLAAKHDLELVKTPESKIRIQKRVAIIAATVLIVLAIFLRWAFPNSVYWLLGGVLFLIFAAAGGLENNRIRVQFQNNVATTLREMASCEDLCLTWIESNVTLGLAIDDRAKKLTVARFSSDGMLEPGPTVISYTDILDAELIVDNHVATTAKTTSGALSRALVGGLIAGPVGAIAGGLSATSTTTFQTTDKLRRIELRLLINDIASPTLLIPIFDGQLPKSHPLCKKAIGLADLWLGRFSVIVRGAPIDSPGAVRKLSHSSDVNITLADSRSP